MLKLFLAGTVTPATGKTLAITISKDGGAFANPSAGATNATEVSDGWYKVTLSTTDTNTLGDFVVRGTAALCDDCERLFVVVKATNAGLTGVPDAVAGATDGLLINGNNGNNSIILGDVTTFGALILGGELRASGGFNISGGLNVSGGTTLGHTSIENLTAQSVSVAGVFNMVGGLNIGQSGVGNLTVSGSTVFAGAVTFNAVTGTTMFNGNVTANGTWPTPTSGVTLADGAITDDKIAVPAEAAGRPTTMLAMLRRAWEWSTNKKTRDRSTGIVSLRNHADDGNLEQRTQSTTGTTDSMTEGS